MFYIYVTEKGNNSVDVVMLRNCLDIGETGDIYFNIYIKEPKWK